MSSDQRFFDFLKARIGLDVTSVGPAIIERARANVELNGFELARATFLDADVNASLRRFLAEGRTFDAIVLDLMIPGLDGFQFIEALNARWGHHEVPVFIWTAMILSPAEVAQLSQSAAAILDKGQGPLDTLLDSLRRWRVGHGDTRSLT